MDVPVFAMWIWQWGVKNFYGIFGPDDDWPRNDLTYECDRQTLNDHEDEFNRRWAFTYTVMDHQEKECWGCVYIIPIHAEEYDAMDWETYNKIQR